jgi:hypothetical protein
VTVYLETECYGFHIVTAPQFYGIINGSQCVAFQLMCPVSVQDGKKKQTWLGGSVDLKSRNFLHFVMFKCTNSLLSYRISSPYKKQTEGHY